MGKRKAKVIITKQVLKRSTAGANSASNLSINDKVMLGRQSKQSGWEVVQYGGIYTIIDTRKGRKFEGVQVVPGYDANGMPKSISKRRTTWGAKRKVNRKAKPQPVPVDTSTVTGDPKPSEESTLGGAALTFRGMSTDVVPRQEYKCEHNKKVTYRVPSLRAGSGRGRELVESIKRNLIIICPDNATHKRKGKWVCSRHGKLKVQSVEVQEKYYKGKYYL